MFVIVSAVTLLAALAFPAALLIERMLRQARTAAALRMESAGGIVEERFVRMGGIDQWIGIRGEDPTNPVLLVLHGGPGCSYSIFTPHLRSWEKYFTIVQWDQRGGGKTFSRMGRHRSGAISFEQLTDDAIEVVEYVLARLLPGFSDVAMKDISAEMLQSFIARLKVSPKSVRNVIALFREMWHSAQAWDYVQHDPFFGITLPTRGLLEERFFSLDEMKRIIEAAKEPLKTYYWILAETGVRAGEIGALPVRNLLLDQAAIRITQNVWHGKIQTVKSVKGNRLCEISPQLVEHLRRYLRRWKPNSAGLLFATMNGTPWDTDVTRKRKLYPLLDRLGIERCGFHAFVTAMKP